MSQLVQLHINKNKYIFYIINILGGSLVLFSYGHGLLTYVDLRAQLWGDIPLSLKPYYTFNMILATLGYFCFTSYILKTNFLSVKHQYSSTYINKINLFYAGIIIPSIFWMPMTFSMLIEPSYILWIAIKVVLGIVGLSASSLMIILIKSKIQGEYLHYYIALIGIIPFWIQTMILDAVVWPYYFRF
tara:strand:+ start:499 stop:1059 length:561 start_codon:yes stop_codon:yes gene_type:complete